MELTGVPRDIPGTGWRAGHPLNDTGRWPSRPSAAPRRPPPPRAL